MALFALFLLVARLNHYLTLKMETIFSFEASVNFDQTTRRHIPEDNNLQI
jgi:hypothetical protein